MTERVCKACGETKPHAMFPIARGGSSHRLRTCKACVTAQRRDYQRPRPANRDKEKLRNWQRQWRAKNQAKYNAYMNEWRAANRERWQQHDLRSKVKKYGLTPEQFTSLLDAQGGKCRICQAPISRGRRQLDIDHCHSSGRVRGLLCSPCNRGLGCFKDDPARLRAAIAYLEE